MEHLGKILKLARIKKKLTLKKVSGFVNIDPAIISKIENEQRKATRQQIIKLIALYKLNKQELLITWLSDKIIHEIGEEKLADKALHAAEEKVSYIPSKAKGMNQLVQRIKNYLSKDQRIIKAWLFGSVVRKENQQGSDVDLMVRFRHPEKISLFDFADIAYKLELTVKAKIDLVEEGCLEPFAFETAKKDMKLIYG